MSMAMMTRQPAVHGRLGDVETTRGTVRVMLTDNPTLEQPATFFSYVALARWLPVEQPVAMFVTFLAVEGRKEANLVFAPRAMRYDAAVDGDLSVPTQIGRWLFSEDCVPWSGVTAGP